MSTRVNALCCCDWLIRYLTSSCTGVPNKMASKCMFITEWESYRNALCVRALLRRCCSHPFLTSSRQWWKPEDKARTNSCTLITVSDVKLGDCDVREKSAFSFCLAFLHTMAAESKSSRYADRAEGFLSTTSTWTSLHAPITICMPYTHKLRALMYTQQQLSGVAKHKGYSIYWDTRAPLFKL